MKVKVAVNGYGTIGKRVAEAVLKQEDMELVGVAKLNPDYEAFLAERKGIRIFAPKENLEKFKEAGLKVEGTVEDMVSASDIVVDATPDGVGAKNKQIYEKLKKPAIFQGGEEAEVAEVSFSSLCNFEEAIGKRFVRVVSCNTTALLRVLCSLKNLYKIKKARAVLIRRAADPREVKKGPINSVTLNPVDLPSHHALDVKTVLRDLDIFTMAYVVPTTLMHVHALNIEVEGSADKEKALEALTGSRRIVSLSKVSKVASTAEVIEIMRDLGRLRNDVPEVVLFEGSVYASGSELALTYAVHQESIVVPENIDAIRAVLGIKPKEESMSLTDKTLGLMRGRIL